MDGHASKSWLTKFDLAIGTVRVPPEILQALIKAEFAGNNKAVVKEWNESGTNQLRIADSRFVHRYMLEQTEQLPPHDESMVLKLVRIFPIVLTVAIGIGRARRIGDQVSDFVHEF